MESPSTRKPLPVSVWHDKHSAHEFPPESRVHTLRLKRWGPDWTLCDVCWTSPPGPADHFWLRIDLSDEGEDGTEVERLETTFAEYLGRHLREVRAMNPFWDAGRGAFLAEWRKAFPGARLSH